MPELALKCLESWKKHLPDYVIKEWNEDNFDLDAYPYAREAYDNRILCDYMLYIMKEVFIWTRMWKC